MNPLDPANFAWSAPCIPCCSQPGGCACALLIPVFSAPFPDYATAATEIANQVSNCVGYTPQTFDSFSATALGNGAAVEAGFEAQGQAQGQAYISISVKAGSTLSVDYEVSSTGLGNDNNEAQASVLGCADGHAVYADSASSMGGGTVTGTFLFGPFAEAGEYVVLVSGQGQETTDPDEFTTCNMFFSISSDDVARVNPVIALWDDSGTTRQLEACPKMLLPPLTESTGDWYASCADAASDMAANSSNCVGYSDPGTSGPFLSSFTATDGGTSLQVAATFSFGAIPHGLDSYGSINAEAGENISMAFTGAPRGRLIVYDDTGASIFDSTSTSSPIVSSSAPYTGRYVVRMIISSLVGDPSWTSGDATVTSSGTLSVNEIQACYDIGLDCPALLDCGDSCP